MLEVHVYFQRSFGHFSGARWGNSHEIEHYANAWILLIESVGTHCNNWWVISEGIVEIDFNISIDIWNHFIIQVNRELLFLYRLQGFRRQISGETVSNSRLVFSSCLESRGYINNWFFQHNCGRTQWSLSMYFEEGEKSRRGWWEGWLRNFQSCCVYNWMFSCRLPKYFEDKFKCWS